MKTKLFYLFIFCLLTACNQQLVIDTAADLPTPLANQYPIDVAVIYDKELREYTYIEDSEDRKNWNISIGASQIDLFNKVLSPLFRKLDIINNTSEVNSTHDAIINPKLLEIQFALPIETQIDLYEVWVKYDIHIQDQDGNTITTLPLTGYGKTPIKFFIQDEEGITTAANQAYRDAGAKLILEFESNPKIKQWLSSKDS